MQDLLGKEAILYEQDVDRVKCLHAQDIALYQGKLDYVV